MIEKADMAKNEYWLSDAMQRYIVSKDDKYIAGKNVLNPSIARCITTREGMTRADASTYISPDCGDDTEITAGKDGYPVAILDEYNHSVLDPNICHTIQAKYPVPNHGPRLIFLKEEDDMSRKNLDIADTEGVAKTITATVQKNHKGTDNFIPTWEDNGSVAELSEDEKDIVVGTLRSKGFNDMTERMHSEQGISPTRRLTIRKLTPGECYRLMGFQQADMEACRQVGQSDTNIFHQAGDSIVTTVLVGIFGEIFGLDYEKAIKDYTGSLHRETELGYEGEIPA